MIRVEDGEAGVQIWTFDRPPANAISGEFVQRLAEVAADAQADRSVRAVVVRGNERFFSAGLDLKAMAAGGVEHVMDFGWGDGIAALWTLSKPTIAEIAGHAIAGGAILALACDVRIASSANKKIGLNETAIGLSFPRGAFEIARHGLPSSTFGRLILEGLLYGPHEAHELGYVHEVVEPESLHDTVMARAKAMAFLPARAYADNKRLWQEPCVMRCLQETEQEREARRGVWRSGDVLAAFAERVATTSKKD